MDLQQEYYKRRKITSKIIRYPDKSNLILRGRGDKKVDNDLLYVFVEKRSEPNAPAHFNIEVMANPVIYATGDLSQFNVQHTLKVFENKYDWDKYEEGLLNWIRDTKPYYEAVPSEEAIFISWELFLLNYDAWFAHFMPPSGFDWIFDSITNENKKERMDSINKVEVWLKSKYERVFSCWRGMRNSLEIKFYADWLIDSFNGN